MCSAPEIRAGAICQTSVGPPRRQLRGSVPKPARSPYKRPGWPLSCPHSQPLQLVSRRSTAHLKTYTVIMSHAHTDMGWGAGHGPYRYTKLAEPALSNKLRRFSEVVTHEEGVDSVSFQPCTHTVETNMDRRVAKRLAMPDGE